MKLKENLLLHSYKKNVCKELKSRSKLAMMFAKSKGYENYSEKWWDTANEFYSKDVEKYINNIIHQHNIKV